MKVIKKTSKVMSRADAKRPGSLRARANGRTHPHYAWLVDREARLQAILNATSEGIITFDNQGIVESLNRAVEKIFGIPASRIVGRNIDRIIPALKSRAPRSANGPVSFEVPNDGFNSVSEAAGHRRGGILFPIELSLSQVQLSKHRIYTCFVRDISERKQTEKSIFESEQRFRTLITKSPDALFIARNSRVAFINSAGLKLFGASSIDQLLGKRVIDLFHPLFHQMIRERFAMLQENQETPLVEEQIVRLDGTVRDVEVAAAPFSDSNGQSIQVTLRDITSRNEARQTLLYYAALVESSDDAIIGETLEGYVTSWNRGAEIIFGYLRTEMLNKHISLIIPPERAREESVILDKVRQGQSVEHYETVRQCKDGRLIDVSVTISPIRDSHGMIIGAAKISRDSTSRRQLEREILEISDREQRRIGYDIHDGLCQHLAAIELKSELLEQKLVPVSKTEAARAGEISQYVREAIGQARALARGLSPVTLETDGLISALQELVLTIEKLFKVRCQLDCDTEVAIENQAVATHLFRLAQEAVSNAIKHSKASQISLQFKKDSERIYLGISDNGIGIPLEPFKSRGMGMRIMRSRAGMIGGTLTVERNLSGGTTVICAAPLPAPNHTVPPNGHQK
jgi:PAS domain S-box-containing protein